MLHVEVARDLRGQGVSEPFFDDVLAIIRDRGLQVRPICGWARGQMHANPAHRDLLADT